MLIHLRDKYPPNHPAHIPLSTAGRHVERAVNLLLFALVMLTAVVAGALMGAS